MRQRTAEVHPGGAPVRPSPGYSPANAKAEALQRLIGGFIVILALLGLDGFVGFFGSKAIRDTLTALTNHQAASFKNIKELQQAQTALRSVEYDILSQPKPVSGVTTVAAIAGVESALHRVFARVSQDDPDIGIWRELEKTSFFLTREVRAVLAGSLSGNQGFEQLLAAHEGVSAALEKLLRSSYDRTEATRQQVEEATWRQAIEDRVLLVACLLASCLYLWTGTRIYYRMSQQSEELNQVSWQLLEKQELLAQRLSRDLHDELGQSLTALKANFSRHAAAGCMDPSWMQDCSDLLKESIRSAHEISQLLRPTLLDDFGLDSALAWLCERFEERNKIRVNYQSDYHWRLDEQAETHVFRIAQEALTNVVRHAEASVVEVHFSKQHGVVRLKISDNGVGLKTRPSRSLPSLGLIGMKARARSLEGEMRLQSAPGEGVAIEVVFPANPAS